MKKCKELSVLLLVYIINFILVTYMTMRLMKWGVGGWGGGNTFTCLGASNFLNNMKNDLNLINVTSCKSQCILMIYISCYMMCRWISYNMVVFNMIKLKKQLNNIECTHLGGGGEFIPLNVFGQIV